MLAVMVNGSNAVHAVHSADRGLNYGDGLFETMLLRGGRIGFLDDHLARLAAGCERLGIAPPAPALVRSEVTAVVGSQQEGVVKILLTRGASGRGYRPDNGAVATRIVSLHDSPQSVRDAIRVRWCDMRLSRNPTLAGIKHLNRLEQVLAQREWNDPEIDEGLMLDYEGELVSATAANVFVVAGGELMTPDLRYCGVRGIMRAAVIRAAQTLGVPVHEEPLWPDTLETAQEVFVTNAVRGVRSVVALDERTWPRGDVAQAIREVLAEHA